MDTLKETFIITQELTDSFAQATGDFNPLHVDPVAARRYQFGSTVIHGIGGLLKALDIIVGKIDEPVAIKNLKVQFNSPVRHGDIVELICDEIKPGPIRITLLTSGKRTQIIDVELLVNTEPAPAFIDNLYKKNARNSKALVLSFADSESLAGEVELVWDSRRMKDLFPHLYKNMPDNQIAVLMGTTNIVGMNCPGLHSVYGGLKVSFDANADDINPILKYTVSKRDGRFSLINIAITHNCAQGDIEALFRPEPIEQPDFTSIRKLVKPEKFKSQQALVIGGSRGVGEITAKLIAAGGGHPIVTYAKGKNDAHRVMDDIVANGGQCDAIRYNVLSPELDVDGLSDNEPITHLYYFASPLIEKSDGFIWSEKIFRKFTDFYIVGLADLLELFVKIPAYRKNGLVVFIPSTIYLDEPQKGFAEYIAAKAATEAFLKQFAFKYPAFQFRAPRLPRMMTDQTSGVANDGPLHAAEIMLKAISGSNTVTD